MSQVQNLITNHLDTWTQAIETRSSAGRGSNNKLNLVGIKKLRELILEMAVRGLLVPQDPNDEPASELLKKIAAEKAQLIKDGKIKKTKALPEITEAEKPFDLPDGWEWSRMQDATIYIQRGKGPKYAEAGKVKVVSQKCIQWAGFDISVAKFVEDSSLDKYQSERFLQVNDLLWNSTGTGTVGRVNVLHDISEPLVADSHVTVIRPLFTNSNFISCYISSASIQQRIEPDSENPLVSGSTKQVELNTSSVVQLPIPLPPLEEQKRIVAKVDELMALCDQLESQTLDSIATHQTLVETLLNQLVKPTPVIARPQAVAISLPEGAENVDLPAMTEQQRFYQAWSLIAQNFDVLFTTEKSIDTLKQTILQLAVMGKLVPQNPNDEPASKLLEKIAKEKAQLIKDKKIKKTKPLPEITEAEKPFDLPNGWEWVRFGEILQISSGDGLTSKQMNENGGIPVFGGNGINGFHDKSNLAKPTLVIGRVGYYCGSIHKTPDSAWVTDNAFEVKFSETNIDIDFLYWLLKGTNLKENDNATAQPVISGRKVNPIPLALPPLNEQAKVVVKVNELMTLCDQLKTQLQTTQQTQINLAQSIAQEALA